MRGRTIGAGAAGLLLLATTGCTSAGLPFDVSHAQEVRPGQDSATIVGWFGEPFTKEDIPGFVCKKRWIWYSAPSQVLFVDFDDSGRVCAR